MSIRFCYFALFLTLLLTACRPEAPRPNETLSPQLQRDLNELNQRFTYRNKPVNPRALDDMTAWISDRFPGDAVAVDVEGTFDSNRYYGEAEQRTGAIGFERTGDGNGSFFYKHIGQLSNGLHVLLIDNNTGGSGQFQSLMLIRFSVQNAFEVSGKKTGRIIMEQVGELALGGDAKLSISSNSVTVKMSGES